nr:unnamed protein product [Digitaria exilis]
MDVPWAGTASIDFALAQLIQVIVLLGTGGLNGGGYMASKYVVLAIYAGILVIHGLINSLPIQWLAWFGYLGAFWNAAVVLVILIPSVAKERASAHFIFTHFNTDDGMGIQDKAYILAMGLLMSQYSLLGYDASAHMTEETKKADWSGPMGLITAVGLSSLFGWIFLVALTSIMTDIPYLLDPGNDSGGYAVAQALYDAFHQRYGSGVGGLFHLGNYGVVVGWVAVAWVSLVTVLFSLPVAYPVVADNFNYAPVLVGGVLFLSVGAWQPRCPSPSPPSCSRTIAAAAVVAASRASHLPQAPKGRDKSKELLGEEVNLWVKR